MGFGLRGQKLSRLFFGLTVFFTANALASIEPELSRLFEKHYHHFYEARYCGKNALGFITAIDKQMGDVDDYAIISVTNKGFSVFGMVNAERARGTAFNKPAINESNWYHHAFVIDKDGYIFDFDFEIAPRAVPATEYIEQMFLDEPECQNPRSGEFCVGREAKLKEYEWKVVRAEDALRNDDSRAKTYLMGEVLGLKGRLLE